LAGALLANGTPRLEHAMATLFALAERGELTIEEQRGAFGRQTFVVTRTPRARSIAAHEEAAIGIVFDAKNGNEPSVGLGKPRTRLTLHLKGFRRAVVDEMQAAGLIDDDRRNVRRRFRTAGAFVLLAAAAAGPALFVRVDDSGAWPMLIPASLAVVGVLGLICSAVHTPLSNEGVRRADAWRSFRRHMSDVARDRQAPPPAPALRHWLPFAVAAGLAPAWASYLKRHGQGAPRWFRAVADSDRGHAFAALVGAGGAGDASAAHGGGSGAAAGGGSSGAS
jgi:hypothetical protein